MKADRSEGSGARRMGAEAREGMEQRPGTAYLDVGPSRRGLRHRRRPDLVTTRWVETYVFRQGPVAVVAIAAVSCLEFRRGVIQPLGRVTVALAMRLKAERLVVPNGVKDGGHRSVEGGVEAVW